MFKREELSKLLKSTTKKTYGFCKAKNTHCKNPNNPWLEFFQDPIVLSATLLPSSLCSQASRNAPSTISPPLLPSSEPHLLPQPSWRSLCSDGLFLSLRAFSVLICWITRRFWYGQVFPSQRNAFPPWLLFYLKNLKSQGEGWVCVCTRTCTQFFLKRYLAIGCGFYLTPLSSNEAGASALTSLCISHHVPFIRCSNPS